MRGLSIFGVIWLGLLGAVACAEDPGGPPTFVPPPANGGSTAAGGFGSGGGGAFAFDPNAGGIDATGLDNRPAVLAPTPPPPISGGNLLITHDGLRAVVADSDRDRLVLVDVAHSKVLATLPLMPGDEPGRAVEDASGKVHVALRGGGAVVTLDVASGSIVARRAACAAPRGIAYDAQQEQLLVACADGKLVALPSSGGDVTSTTSLGPDLRDVIVNDSGTWVSTFKSAKLLKVQNATVSSTLTLPSLAASRNFQPEVAWRAAPFGKSIVVLHQAALVDPIALPVPGSGGAGGVAFGGAGGVGGVGVSGVGYGSGVPCGAVVLAALSIVDTEGNVRTGAALGTGVLPVDFDIAANGDVAVAFASGSSPGNPNGSLQVYPSGALALDYSAAALDNKGSSSSQFGECGLKSAGTILPSGVVAVRFSPTVAGRLFALTRNPSRLYTVATGSQATSSLDLGGDDTSDTGHALFHDDGGRGVACASCHPEGSEDGHVWNFSGVGLRRTQAVNTDLANSAPYHWDGDLADLGSLMEAVFVSRMGGAHESPERVSALQRWLFALEPLPALRDTSDAAAQRGAALFASTELGCTTCHSGTAPIQKQSVLVGTGAKLQVPSLLGIGHRAPFMHSGCAASLKNRFDAACGGGEQHGHTAQLSATQVDDLVAYLETL